MAKLLILVLVLAAIAGGTYYAGYWPSSVTPAAGPGAPAPAKDDAFTKGDKFFVNNQYQAAADTYRDAVKDHPESPRAAEASFRIGKALEDAGKPSEALAAYKEYLAKNPNDGTRSNRAKERIDFLAGTGAQ